VGISKDHVSKLLFGSMVLTSNTTSRTEVKNPLLLQRLIIPRLERGEEVVLVVEPVMHFSWGWF
jgi:hypothetical protein